MSSCPIRTPAKSVPTTMPEAEAAELDAADQEADGQREEDRQFRILLQGSYEIVHVMSPVVVTATKSQ